MFWEDNLVFPESEHNLAGHELLEFCAINSLSIMNPWFQKKEIHKGTWTHPATKKGHMIDSVLTPILELNSPSSEEELSQALSKLRKQKAGGN